MTNFLQGQLHLKVNKEKSAVAPVEARKFLAHRLLPDGSLGIAPESLSRVKARIRQITRRTRGISLSRMIAELNAYLVGWVTYFRSARLARATCSASTHGCVEGCAVCGSSSAKAARPSPPSWGAVVSRQARRGSWPAAAEAGGPNPTAPKPQRP